MIVEPLLINTYLGNIVYLVPSKNNGGPLDGALSSPLPWLNVQANNQTYLTNYLRPRAKRKEEKTEKL
jgi:hypothetical protein